MKLPLLLAFMVLPLEIFVSGRNLGQLRLNFSLFFHATVTIGLDLGQLLPKTFDLLLRDLGAGRWGRGGG